MIKSLRCKLLLVCSIILVIATLIYAGPYDLSHTVSPGYHVGIVKHWPPAVTGEARNITMTVNASAGEFEWANVHPGAHVEITWIPAQTTSTPAVFTGKIEKDTPSHKYIPEFSGKFKSGGGTGGGGVADLTWDFKADIDIIGVEKIDVWDSDKRYAADGLLEIVPPLRGENINGKAFIKPEDIELPADFPIWAITGYWTSTLKGKEVSFSASNYPSQVLWLLELAPRTYTITCENHTVTLKAYTDSKGKMKLAAPDLDAFLKAMESLEKVAEKVGSPVGVGAKLKGNFSFENQWVEVKKSNLALYTWALDAKSTASAHVKLKFGTGVVGIPPAILEAAAFVKLKGALGVKGEAGVNPAGEFNVNGGGYGSIDLKVGGEIDVVSGLAAVKLAAESSIKASGDLVGVPKPPQVYAQVKVTADALRIVYDLELLWGVWTYTKEWPAWKTWPLYDEKVQIIPWPN